MEDPVSKVPLPDAAALPAGEVERASTTEGLPIAPSLGPVLAEARMPTHSTLLDRRGVVTAILAVGIGLIAAAVAEALTRLIWLITNVAFHHRLSDGISSFAGSPWLLILLVPIAGGLVVGLMARYGSQAIRGHGIPEAMEQVLLHESRIPARVTFLKPLSAAVAIGTGGPFGLEGPIIATGGAIGSLVGQVLNTTPGQRKTLLAAGAAAGMAATFGTPVSAILLAMELLLFEMRARSLIAVAFAAAVAAGTRHAIFHSAVPVFPMPSLLEPGATALGIYALLGALIGLVAVGATRAVYAIEDGFGKLRLHWMWWPAIGAVAVGVVGCIMPRTLGVGYDNITDMLGGRLSVGFVAMLGLLKLISWAVSLGSGTSGGTLAPLFTIGGAVGLALGAAAAAIWPGAGVDPRIAGLVGMAAMFTGASRAMLTSIVFALEATWQTSAISPLVAGCAAAFLVSCLLMPETIMTLKVTRHGVRVPSEYEADPLDHVFVHEIVGPKPVTLREDQPVEEVRRWLASGEPGSTHQGFPVLDAQGNLRGVVTRRDLVDHHADLATIGQAIKRPPVIVYEDSTLRDAVNQMVDHDIGRLPIMSGSDRARLIGFITRSDLISVQRKWRR